MSPQIGCFIFAEKLSQQLTSGIGHLMLQLDRSSARNEKPDLEGGLEARSCYQNSDKAIDLLRPENSLHMRNDLRPGDVGYITYLHGILYAPQQGWDHTFDSYVAIPLAEFARRCNPKERIWIVESGGWVAGSVAIIEFSQEEAQLRWLLLHPDLRGKGLGRRLVEEAVAFARVAGYSSIFLWTVDSLPAAADLYKSVGFQEKEKVTHELWGSLVTEMKYELELK